MHPSCKVQGDKVFSDVRSIFVSMEWAQAAKNSDKNSESVWDFGFLLSKGCARLASHVDATIFTTFILLIFAFCDLTLSYP